MTSGGIAPSHGGALTADMRKLVVADDKGETMTIKVNEADLLNLLGENGERWRKGRWGDKDGMCLHGAIRRCSPQPGDASLIEQVASLQGWGTNWNDAVDTDWTMIRQRLAHVEVTDTDLADTFGPQWEHVVALVRRAAVLTKDEVRQLAAVWNAAQGAAWDDARVNAWHAVWYAVRAAAWSGAPALHRVAARNAAWYAVRLDVPAAKDVAVALVNRDQIGQSEFTQEHYDTFTGPWATVIGPVHPDDEARRG